MADAHPHDLVSRFLARSSFRERGGVITDLDGTAVHEVDGRIAIAPGVIEGLRQVWTGGRPIVLNTLRFPLNVIRTFGRAWYDISSAPVPLVSLNGAILGDIDLDRAGGIVFRERTALPLPGERIAAALAEVEAMLSDGLDALSVFIYPRDWQQGEIVWTSDAARVPAIVAKYKSASEVFAGPTDVLAARLAASEPCMLFFMVEAPADRLMAYQHARPASFLTADGVDKLSGARAAAALLGFDLPESVGAGDTPMDRFLEGVGLGVHVGPLALDFRAAHGEVRIGSAAELGAILHQLAAEAPPA